MALAIGHHRVPRRSGWAGHVAGFVLGFAVGLVLTALLTLYVWPAVIPFGERLVPEDTGRAAAVAMALVCGVATDVMVTARHASRRRR